MSERLVNVVSLTIVVRDEREGRPCPSASLFQNMDPGYNKWEFKSPYAAVEDTITSLQVILRQESLKWCHQWRIYFTCAIVLINKMLSRAFCSLSKLFLCIDEVITCRQNKRTRWQPEALWIKWLTCWADTLGLKARVLGLNGSTTEGYGSNMMLLREDSSAALHMATSKSTTCRTSDRLIDIIFIYWELIQW